MKFLYILLFTTFSFYSALHAQEKGKVEFGFGVGVNSSTLTDGKTINAKYRTAPNFGISVDYYLSERWSLKSKLIYDPKGWNDGYFSDENNSYSTDYHVDYLTIPFMANWHFGKTRNWYFNFGPYLGILLNAKETVGNKDVKGQLYKVDGGLNYGLGVKIPVEKNIKFYLEFDVQNDMINIEKNAEGSSAYNNRLAFNVGINF